MRDVKTTAELWGISTTRVTRLCRDGKIAGAVKEGKSWLIPEDAVKPADGRRKGSHEEGKDCRCRSAFRNTGWLRRSIIILTRRC